MSCKTLFACVPRGYSVLEIVLPLASSMSRMISPRSLLMKSLSESICAFVGMTARLMPPLSGEMRMFPSCMKRTMPPV